MLPLPKHFKLSAHTRWLLKKALAEDIGSGDITSRILVRPETHGKARIIARESGIFCGGPVVRELFRLSDPELKVEFLVQEGKPFTRSKVVLQAEGCARSILKAERTVLNFLGPLSGIATKTRKFIEKVKGYPVLILDTRKTTPLWRELEKYAVRVGGGRNHRRGLYDAIFVKENHRAKGDLARLKNFPYQFIIEVHSLRELKDALSVKPRGILFDNFSPSLLRKGVRLARRLNPEIILEASGGITLENVAHYAAMGVDWISVGSLTHSVKAVDYSLLIH